MEFYWSNVEVMGISDRHNFRVEATDGGKAKFIQSDRAFGGFTWLLGKRVARAQREIYPLFNQALKAEVERRFSGK